jgi:serine/threonine-protein kinase
MEQRFILEKENIVLDKETGLMWQREASTLRTVWKDGFDYIAKLNSESFAGYSDWRYPTQDELAGLILAEEDRKSGLYIDPLFGNQRNCWSSSRQEGHRHEACYADFYYGDMYVVEENYANLFVRAVRSGGAA